MATASHRTTAAAAPPRRSLARFANSLAQLAALLARFANSLAQPADSLAWLVDSLRVRRRSPVMTVGLQTSLGRPRRSGQRDALSVAQNASDVAASSGAQK